MTYDDEPKYGRRAAPSVTPLPPARPAEVVIVRPNSPGYELASTYLGLVLLTPLWGWIVMLLAGIIDGVPDWGYWESVAVYLLAGLLFKSRSGYTYWTKAGKQ